MEFMVGKKMARGWEVERERKKESSELSQRSSGLQWEHSADKETAWEREGITQTELALSTVLCSPLYKQGQPRSTDTKT